MNLSPVINFINILFEAWVFFEFLGFACINASHKHVGEIEPRWNICLPCFTDFVAADDDPGQVKAEKEDDDAEGDVRHV